VAFIDPRGSHVAIIQAVGRAIRLSDDKTIGTIVVPVFIEDGDNIESSMQSSHFKPVWEVLNALKSHDEVLAYELDELRTDLGRGGKLIDSEKSFSKIAFDLPTTIDESFAESLRTFLIEKTTSSWNFWFGLLEVFVEEHDHARVPKSYKANDVFKLGVWVGTQRLSRAQLNTERIGKLEALSGWVWNLLEFQWEQGFAYLEAYGRKEGHVRVSQGYETSEGYKLGGWVSAQKTKRTQLTAERLTRLESLNGWAWNFLEYQWEEGFNYLEAYVQRQGHARVPANYKTPDGFKLGSWLSNKKSAKDQLTKEQISRLESLKGWAWDVSMFQWEQGFSYLEQYVQQEGHARVPLEP